MLTRIKAKLGSSKGSDKGVLLIGIIVMFSLIIYIVLSRYNVMFDQEVSRFHRGLKKGAQAALLQVDMDNVDNIENIARGFILEGEDAQVGYNHQLKLNHSYSNQVALKMLARKTGFTQADLSESFKSSIIEPIRRDSSTTDYKLQATFYTDGDFRIYETPYFDFLNTGQVLSHFDAIESWINQQLNNEGSLMEIRLTGINEGFARNMEVKTYYLSIVDGFNPQPVAEAIYDDPKLIQVYYFEGANLMRGLEMRDKN